MRPSFHNWAGDRRLKGLVFLVLALSAIALVAYTYLTVKSGKYVNNYGPVTISVHGVGEVTKVPDVAMFSFVVHAEDKEPAAAQKASAEQTNTILAYLKKNDIAETDIKTLNYNLSPLYKQSSSLCAEGYFCPPDGPPEIVGYTVDQTVQVKIHNTKKAGDLLADVGKHGASNISSLALTVDDDTSAKAEARAKAVIDAKEKAQQLADALGVRLVRLTSFYEEENGGPYPMMDTKSYEGGMMGGSTAVAPTVPVGENTIRSAVNLTYEIE